MMEIPGEIPMPKRKKMAPIHPGEVLQIEFLQALGLSQYRLAKDVSVPPRRINEIVRGDRAITADTALRLARYFAHRNASGSTCRFDTILKWNGTGWADALNAKLGSGQKPPAYLDCNASVPRKMLALGWANGTAIEDPVPWLWMTRFRTTQCFPPSPAAR